MSRLVDWLVRERSERVSHGLYYNTQIAMGYNSNHMEGSTLTPEQTAQLFTTGSVLADGPDDIIRADDVIEMGNHFRMFDWMLDHVDDPVDKTMVCTMQSIPETWHQPGIESGQEYRRIQDSAECDQ